jgi:hypothetical protein
VAQAHHGAVCHRPRHPYPVSAPRPRARPLQRHLLRLARRLPLHPRAPQGHFHPLPHPLRRSKPPLLRQASPVSCKPARRHTRRGVVFISEIVPRPAITLVARALYGEAYSTARTRHTWSTTPDALAVRYDWRHRGHWQTVSVQASAIAQPIAPGSTEEFITEHYWGYTKRRNLFGRKPSTGEYGVAHPRWQVYPILNSHVAADFGSLYGPAFAHLTQRNPDHVLLAEGSAIAIRSGGHFTA